MGGLDMKTAIEKIMITERIRKEITKIPELADDIRENGLLNPVTVMSLDGGEFRLLAGLRRIRAAQMIGWPEIEVNIVSPADAEAALKIEFSENEQREPFTYSENMDYARLVEEIEKEKAKERKAEGQSLGGAVSGRGRQKDDSLVLHGAPSYDCSKKKTRDIVGEKINMSGQQYDRAKYIADHATPEIIEQLDKGERSIRGTYDELKAKEKSAAASVSNNETEVDDEAETSPKRSQTPSHARTVTEEDKMKLLSEKDREGIRKIQEYEALPPEGKIAELQRQIKELRTRAAIAESDLASLKERYEISIDHKDSIIESLKRQNAELDEALTAANMRITELEAGS